MARPNNAPMGAGFKKMNKDSLIRLLVDEMKKNTKLEEENKKLNEDYKVLGILNDEIRRINENLREENKKLKERINTMQEFIDYSEGVVQNAIGMLYEEGGEDKALDYLENCYVTGDDKQYEEMERLYKDV